MAPGHAYEQNPGKVLGTKERHPRQEQRVGGSRGGGADGWCVSETLAVILGEKEEDGKEREEYKDGDKKALVLGEMAQCPVLTESSLLRAIDAISNTVVVAQLIGLVI